ncbi:hypothetical protein ACIRJR_21215 [Streptomyces sp. NPDC102402]
MELPASHLVPLEKPDQVNHVVLDHFANDPAETMLPVRRARSAVADPA